MRCSELKWRAAQIEHDHPCEPDQAIKTEHLGLVTTAVMQTVAAVEAESAELAKHGPGHHLGSDHMDNESRDFLAPLAGFIDKLDALTRYEVILHILKKEPLIKGERVWGDMAVLVRLRNELIHYKSKWGSKMDSQQLSAALKNLHLAKPAFGHAGGVATLAGRQAVARSAGRH